MSGTSLSIPNSASNHSECSTTSIGGIEKNGSSHRRGGATANFATNHSTIIPNVVSSGNINFKICEVVKGQDIALDDDSVDDFSLFQRNNDAISFRFYVWRSPLYQSFEHCLRFCSSKVAARYVVTFVLCGPSPHHSL